MANKIRPELPELPHHMRNLPIDDRGFPVPWFVAWFDGKPDHRVVDPRKMVAAIKESRCWVCGEQLGTYKAFVIGPMSAINRISGEPPSHRECAEFAVRGCPFLSNPDARRRSAGMPEDVIFASPSHMPHNPGSMVIWVTKDYKVIRGGADEILFSLGPPTNTQWYTAGRNATRQEVLDSVAYGLPLLLEAAAAESTAAVARMQMRAKIAEQFYPSE